MNKKETILSEKLKALLNELKKDIQGLREKSERNNEIDELRSFSIVYLDIERLEQKYFPKEVNYEKTNL